MSLAFSGVIIFFTSFSLRPRLDIKTLSSASVALINILLRAFAKLFILSIDIPSGAISIAVAVIIQLHIAKLSSSNGNGNKHFSLSCWFFNILSTSSAHSFQIQNGIRALLTGSEKLTTLSYDC